MMTKEQANNVVNELIRKPEYMMIKWKRFHSNQAWIGKFSERYDFIKSYSTIVGLIDKEERVLYELGKWSRTTSIHVSKIQKELYTFYDFIKA